jgi:DHA1 family bicyclomycin/chloramphenicol resistance-like MFS transporter
MVRDLFAPAEGARVLAASSTLLGIAPLLGPIAGGLLVAVFDWRSAFALLLLLSLALGVFTLMRLRETNLAPNPRALQPGPMLRTYAAVLRSPTWHAYTWTASASYAGLFAFISGGSFVLIRVLDVPAALYGLCFSFVVSGYVIGTIVCRHSVAQVGVARTLARGATLQVASGLALAALAWAGVHHPLAILVPQFFFLAAHGLILPVAQAGAVARFPANAGAASALMGCTMMIVAAAVGTWIGASYDGTVYPLALTIAAASLATAVATVTLVYRHGHID